ncbi:hypothetical protein WA158_007603 [Blastocystis sp. Blastoise]
MSYSFSSPLKNKPYNSTYDESQDLHYSFSNDENDNKESQNEESPRKSLFGSSFDTNTSLDDAAMKKIASDVKKKLAKKAEPFNVVSLVENKGIDALVEKVSKTPFHKHKSTAKKTELLISLYKDWCLHLYSRKPFVDVISQVETSMSKQLIREHMAGLRKKEEQPYIDSLNNSTASNVTNTQQPLSESLSKSISSPNDAPSVFISSNNSIPISSELIEHPIDIDNDINKNIDIDIDNDINKNIDIDIDNDIDNDINKNIDIDIDNVINIDIDNDINKNIDNASNTNIDIDNNKTINNDINTNTIIPISSNQSSNNDNIQSQVSLSNNMSTEIPKNNIISSESSVNQNIAQNSTTVSSESQTQQNYDNGNIDMDNLDALLELENDE